MINNVKKYGYDYVFFLPLKVQSCVFLLGVYLMNTVEI